MMCADMLDVHWKDSAERTRRATALLEDISQHGACLQLEKELPLGTEIVMEVGKLRLTGTIRYCVYREIGYFLGVEFAPDSQWSQDKFEPKHLLDLEKLVKRAAKKAAKREN